MFMEKHLPVPSSLEKLISHYEARIETELQRQRDELAAATAAGGAALQGVFPNFPSYFSNTFKQIPTQ
jgi:hypothetical protein